MNDGDLLALELVAREFRPQHALLVVTAAGAERIPKIAVGDLGVGRRRGDEEDAVLLVDVGGGDGHAGIEVADDELDAVANELVGHRHALLRIGDVVALLEGDLLAEDAARLVDVVNRLLRAVDELSPESRVRTGDRAGDPHLDLCAGGARKRQGREKRDA